MNVSSTPVLISRVKVKVIGTEQDKYRRWITRKLLKSGKEGTTPWTVTRGSIFFQMISLIWCAVVKNRQEENQLATLKDQRSHASVVKEYRCTLNVHSKCTFGSVTKKISNLSAFIAIWHYLLFSMVDKKGLIFGNLQKYTIDFDR